MKILKTKIENIRGQQVRVYVVAPSQPMRRGCTPQPSYIHGPWVTAANRQPLYTRSK
jgi:hypothetical protein